MSLINQVLQDLEKRHASEPELKSLPPHVRAIPERAGTSGRTLLLGAAALIILAALAAYLYFSGGLRSRTDLPVAAVTPAASPVPPPVVAEKPVPAAAEPVAELETYQAAPASRLSEELSFVPGQRARREVAPKMPAMPAPKTSTSRPAALKPAPDVSIPEGFRAAIEVPPAARPAEPQPVAARAPELPASVVPAPPNPVASANAPVVIDKQVREMTAQQRAEVAFRKGVAQLQEARASLAEASFREALKEDQNHVAARQALLGLLLDAKRNDEAEQLLRKTLELNPRQPRHAMVLARLEVDRGEVTGAISTLVAALPYVQSDPEYYAFLAALLQREDRHRESVDYYRAALRLSPGNALWLMGVGISLRATSQFADARESFQRALETKQLNGELQAFTERQLRELASPKK